MMRPQNTLGVATRSKPFTRGARVRLIFTSNHASIKMNYYTFHSGDYLRDTSHLSLIEDAIYRRCLDWYYTNESPLPNDFKKIARLIRASDFLADVEQVVSEFFILGENGWTQSRCDAEISIYHEKAQKARENGQKGGRPKTKTKPNHNPQETESVILANQTLTESKANQEPRTNNQEPINNNKKNKREENFQKSEQDFIDKVTTDNRKTFPITFDWKPNDSQFAAYCQRKLITPNQLTKEIFDKFVDKTTAKGEVKTEAQWCELLASYLKTCLDNPIPKKPNPHIYQPERTGQEASQSSYEPVYKPFEPLTEAEKTKTPLDALEKMRQKLRGAV